MISTSLSRLSPTMVSPAFGQRKKRFEARPFDMLKAANRLPVLHFTQDPNCDVGAFTMLGKTEGKPRVGLSHAVFSLAGKSQGEAAKIVEHNFGPPDVARAILAAGGNHRWVNLNAMGHAFVTRVMMKADSKFKPYPAPMSRIVLFSLPTPGEHPDYTKEKVLYANYQYFPSGKKVELPLGVLQGKLAPLFAKLDGVRKELGQVS